MTEFSITHEFDTDPATFWQVYLDGEFQNAMYRAVGVVRSELSRVQSKEQIVVVARYASERQLPAFVRSLLGKRDLGYLETITYRPQNGDVAQLIEPGVLGDRFRFHGAVTVEELAPGRVRRTYAGSIAIDVPLVGRRIEQATVNEMKRTHEEAAVVTREWLSKAAA